MRDDHPHDLAIDVQIDIERSPGFASRDTQIGVAHRHDGSSREQGVPVRARLSGQRRTRHAPHAGQRLQPFHLIDLLRVMIAPVDFLKANHVCVDVADHLRDTIHIVPSVDTDAAMDVIGRDANFARLPYR